MKETDTKTKQLFEIVEQKKKEIARAEKPNWETNLAFNYSRDSGNTSQRVNIQIVSDVSELVYILSFLDREKAAWDKAAAELAVKTKFSWHGYTYDQWKADLVARADKIRISEKRKELANLESRLNAILSPELKAQLELEAISKELGV